MAQSAPLILRLVASSVTAANRAGKIIRDVMCQGDLGIVEKGKNDLQTEADRSAQRCIVTSLSRQFPSITIIGEEGPSNCEVPSDWVVTDSDPEVLTLPCPDKLQNVQDHEVVIWVDPMDGTSEYTQGLLDHVTVLIGIAVGDQAIGGVIHQPYYNYKTASGDDVGRTIWGIVGVGTGGFEAKPPPQGRRIITTTRTHSTPVVEAALEALQPDEVLRVGGSGHKVMLLLEGKANAYVFASAGMKRWDTCAPEAILHAIGGQMTDVHGNRYCYNKDTPYPNTSGVLASARGEDHSWYLKTLPDALRQTLV